MWRRRIDPSDDRLPDGPSTCEQRQAAPNEKARRRVTQDMSTDASVVLLLRLLDEAYDHKGWHGPNLKGTIRGLDAAAATWRPSPSRHNIRELVLHMAYWKYAVRRRLTGERRGSFSLEGSNWFRRDDPDPRAWKEETALLQREHGALREAVTRLSARDLSRRVGQHDFARLVFGAASHDLYHTGQVAMVKRLYRDRTGR